MTITPQQIYQETNGGLDILLRFYPQIEPASRNKNHKFSIRDEKTPSCVLYTGNDGRYCIKDFGSGEWLDAFDVVKLHHKCDFGKAMGIVIEMMGIVIDEKKAKKFQATYSKLVPNDDETEGAIVWELKPWTAVELKAIFSDQVWSFLSRKYLKEGEKGSEEKAIQNAIDIVTDYNLYALAWYSIVKRDKNDNSKLVKHRFDANDQYPILMFDEGNWQKFYKPKEREHQYRFFSSGQKKDDYIFGYQEAYNACEALKPDKKYDENGEDITKNKAQKLPEIIVCSGGSDALNVAALGYQVVWLNSETADLKPVTYQQLKTIAELVYNLPDIDDTGLRCANALAAKYMDIHTIFLPKSLSEKRDIKGKPCKDVRDFFRYSKKNDFDNLVKTAKPLKFWDENMKFNRKGEPVIKKGKFEYEYRPNNELIYNFLYRMGYGLLDVRGVNKRNELMVKIEDNVVAEVEYRHVNKYIKDFLRSSAVVDFLKDGSSLDLINAFHRSPNFSESSLSNLPYHKVEFNDFGKDFQYLFFQNQTWRVTAEGIEASEPKASKVMVWDSEVVKHDVKKLDKFFTISRRESDGQADIQIHNSDCLYFKFLVNTSRVHWRKELEDELDKFPKSRAEYLATNQFKIDGPLLSADEILEQKIHLINKITALGYLLHRYKDPAKAFAIWAVDYNIQNSEDSNGGTGKSMAFTALFQLMKHEAFEGRNPKLTTNPHIFENISEHTDLMLVDDAYKYFDFDFFYSVITSFIRINPKGSQGFMIAPDKSPKLCITSNFPPSRNDKATRRRLWFTAFSDYYHKNPNGEYREERLPNMEFGKSLFTDYTDDEWNLFLNFCAQCLQAWLEVGQVEPPMETLMQNQYKNEMGPTFHAWADVYFSDENKRLDAPIPRYMAYEIYKKEYQANLSSQGFMDKIRSWCRYNDYTLNPPAALTTKDKRITKFLPKMELQRGNWVDTGKKESVECIYIQTNIEKPINDEVSRIDLPF
jgi:5S rRNA maturation endonuclease (ribonuclease M5)